MSKRAVITTPRGRAIYPHLNTPDTKFDTTGAGAYRVKLAIKTSLVEGIIKQIDDAVAAKIAEANADPKAKKDPKTKSVKEATLPYSLNPDNEDETILSFKANAQFKAKDGSIVNSKPALYDAKLKPLAASVKVGGGSTLRISFEIVPYYIAAVGAGVSLRLKGAQVLELKSYGASAEGMGFQAEEGYEAEVEEANPFAAPEATTEAQPAGEGSDF